MKSLVIFGAGEIAEVAGYYFAHDSEYSIAAYTVDSSYISGSTFGGRPLVPFDQVEQDFPPKDHEFFVALSYAKLNQLRADRCTDAESKGYRLVSYVSSKATVWPDLSIGANSFILEDNTIQPFARIGRNVTLWSGNHIGHHAHIGDNCFITSHVVVSGAVKIGNNCFIGVNATIRDHITIGARSVIGAGSLIVKDVADNCVFSASAAELSPVPSNRLRKL